MERVPLNQGIVDTFASIGVESVRALPLTARGRIGGAIDQLPYRLPQAHRYSRGTGRVRKLSKALAKPRSFAVDKSTILGGLFVNLATGTRRRSEQIALLT